MNHLLASIVGLLNGLLAMVIIGSGGVLGWNASGPQGDGKLVLFGLGLGFLVALFVCGILAVFISMRAELVEIRRLLEKISNPSAGLHTKL